MSEEADRIERTAAALLASAREAGLALTGDGRVSETDAAALLGLAAGSLKNLRHEGGAPPAYRAAAHGCRWTYRIADLAGWIEGRREDW